MLHLQSDQILHKFDLRGRSVREKASAVQKAHLSKTAVSHEDQTFWSDALWTLLWTDKSQTEVFGHGNSWCSLRFSYELCIISKSDKVRQGEDICRNFLE